MTLVSAHTSRHRHASRPGRQQLASMVDNENHSPRDEITGFVYSRGYQKTDFLKVEWGERLKDYDLQPTVGLEPRDKRRIAAGRRARRLPSADGPKTGKSQVRAPLFCSQSSPVPQSFRWAAGPSPVGRQAGLRVRCVCIVAVAGRQGGRLAAVRVGRAEDRSGERCRPHVYRWQWRLVCRRCSPGSVVPLGGGRGGGGLC